MIDFADIAEEAGYEMPPLDVSSWSHEDKLGLVRFVLDEKKYLLKSDIPDYTKRVIAVAVNYQDTGFDLEEFTSWIGYAQKYGFDKLSRHLNSAKTSPKVPAKNAAFLKVLDLSMLKIWGL